jgi:ABC-type transport system involved in multi-copper enzyme maturation permease subunit
MNALVKKEIRLLLPNLLIGCALALANLMFRFNPDGSLMGAWWFVLAFVLSGAMAVMLALNSFGAEVSLGTFSNLLAQPISRQKIWDTKIALLAVALFIVGVCWSGCGIARLMMLGRELHLLDLFSGVVTFGLVVFSGALWTVLLLRQVAAAFWFTLLVPGVLLVPLAACFAEHDGNLFQGWIVSVLGLYSLAGFFFARWLFFRAQDVQWSGGSIVMPELRWLPAWFSKLVSLRIHRPHAALWRKEFMLHQSQFVMAFVLLLLHLGVLGVRHFHDLSNSRDLKFTLEVFWGLWLVMPLLVGCAAVAEERKIGTLEGQLCLPVKRRTQFAVKFFVALFLSLLLGVGMPLLLEGMRILPGAPFDAAKLQHVLTNAQSPAQFDFWFALEILNGYLPLLALAGIALLIGGVAFYASSLARNTLQSLTPAVLGILLMAFLLFAAAMPWGHECEFLWRGPLAYFIGVPLVLLTLVTLAYWNFQQVKASAQMGWRNVLAFLLAVVLGMTTTVAVYHRAWEKLTPFEPAHGAPRLSLADSVRLENDWRNLIIRLPEGKIWQARFKYTPPNPLAMLLGNFKAPAADGGYLSGSNWTAVVDGFWFQQVGLKTDGT